MHGSIVHSRVESGSDNPDKMGYFFGGSSGLICKLIIN